MKTWCVTVSKDDPRDWWYVRAETKSQAKKIAYDQDPSDTMLHTDWTDIRVRRIPELDGGLTEAGLMEIGKMCREWEGEIIVPSTVEQTCILICADY